MRAAWCLDLWQAATGDQRQKFHFVVSENVKPYEPGRRSLGPTFMQLGRRSYATMLANYCQCLSTRTWPSYDMAGEGQAAWTEFETEPWMHQGEAVSGGTAAEVAPLVAGPDGEAGGDAA